MENNDVTVYLAGEITTPQDELKAACLLASAEKHLRDSEEKRTALTRPLNEALRKINAESKSVTASTEEMKAELQRRLGAYRARPEIREAIARRERAESKLRYAEREGDAVGMRNADSVIAEVNAVVPKSVPAGDMVIRYRRRRTYEIDESQLHERFLKKVPDTGHIEEALDRGEVVRGVEERVEYVPYAVAVGSKDFNEPSE